jgi:hypothetical protein
VWRTDIPDVELLNDDDDTKYNTDCDPDMVPDEGSCTICGVVMQLIFILKNRAAD